MTNASSFLATRRKLVIGVVIVVLILAASLYMAYPGGMLKPPTKELRKITFVSDFQFEGRHAPYFVAMEKGYYKESGIDVEFMVGRGSQFSIEVVASGKAQFGLAGGASIIAARANDVPIVAVAMLFQQDPLGIWTLPASGIKTPNDLVGKKVGVRTGGTDFAEWRALLKQVGISPEKVQEVPVGFDPVQPLLTKQVDAALGWEEDRPGFEANKLTDAIYIPFRNYGINFYVTGIIVTEEFLQKNRPLIQDFVAASLKGWQAALKDPQTAMNIFLSKNPELKMPREMNMLNIAINQRIISETTKKFGLGYMDEERWQKMVDVLFENGVIKKRVDTKTLFTNDLLPKPPILPQSILKIETS